MEYSIALPQGLLKRESKVFKSKRVALSTKEKLSKDVYQLAARELAGKRVGSLLLVYGKKGKSIYLKVRRDKIHTISDAVLLGR